MTDEQWPPPDTEIRVLIKYLVALKEKAGREQEEKGFPQGTSLQDIAGWLEATYGISTTDSQVMATLNGKGWRQYPLGPATEVKDGDRIALFPLLSGG